MARFGDELREAREARAVSLQEISERTKVSVRHLIALEAEDYARMPGGVFLKGVFRSYLGELQLREPEWMPRFQESLQLAGVDSTPDETKLAEFAQAVKRSRSIERPRNRYRWVGVLVMLSVLGAAGFFAWKFVIRPRLAPPALPPAPLNQTIPAPAPAPEATSDSAPAASSEPAPATASQN